MCMSRSSVAIEQHKPADVAQTLAIQLMPHISIECKANENELHEIKCLLDN